MFIHDGETIPTAPTKDPDAVIDYGSDWRAWLQDGESISVSAWLIPNGLTGSIETNAQGITGVTLSGGSSGDNYTITNRITTSLGRTEDRSMHIRCRNK